MSARKPAMSSEARAVLLVIIFLGVTVILLVLGTMWLVHEVIGKAEHGKVSTSQVSVLTAVVGLTGTALGSLGTMLASTSGKSSPAVGDPPTPVNVVNAPADPVPTSDVPAPAVKPAPHKRTPVKKTTRRSRQGS